MNENQSKDPRIVVNESENSQNNQAQFSRGQLAMKRNFPFFSMLALVVGLLFNLCFYRNMDGSIMTFVFAAGIEVIFVLCLRKLGIKLKKDGLFYLAAFLLLGLSNFLTADSRIQAMNMIAGFAVIVVFMLRQCYDDKSWTFGGYLLSIFYLLLDTLISLGQPFRDFQDYRKERSGDEPYKKGRAVLLGVLIAAPLLAVAILMLSSADAVFEDMFWGLSHLYDYSFDAIFVLIITVVLFFLAYGFFSSLSRETLLSGKKENRKWDPVVAVTFMSLLALVYLLFCGIQIVYLFLKKGSLPQPYSYAGYAREGFFQLLFICVMNLVLVLLCLGMFRENRMLKIILTVISGCTYIMTASSAYRMFLYIRYYNLTFLRVFVLWALLVIAFVLTGIVVGIYRRSFPLFRFTMAVITAGYVVFSFSHPDYFIAKYNYSAVKEEFFFNDYAFNDYAYSMDAVPALIDIARKDSRLREQGLELSKRYAVIQRVRHQGVRNFNLARNAAFKEAEEFQKEARWQVGADRNAFPCFLYCNALYFNRYVKI